MTVTSFLSNLITFCRSNSVALKPYCSIFLNLFFSSLELQIILFFIYRSSKYRFWRYKKVHQCHYVSSPNLIAINDSTGHRKKLPHVPYMEQYSTKPFYKVTNMLQTQKMAKRLMLWYCFYFLHITRVFIKFVMMMCSSEIVHKLSVIIIMFARKR